MRNRFQSWIFPICIAILIAFGTSVVSCTHFALKVGELKDAEVILDTTSDKE